MTDSTLTVGMDVHRDSISVAVLRGWDRGPLLEQTLPNSTPKIRRFFDRLVAQGPMQCCYEASSCGFVMKRLLDRRKIPCEVIAPSLIPHRRGDRRKTDRLDALNLAKLYRAGQLTAIRVPTKAEEAIRGLVRCRETLMREAHRSRQHVLKHLYSRGFVYRDGGNWTKGHWAWLRSLALEAQDKVVLDTHLGLLDMKLTLLDETDAKVSALSRTEPYAGPVARLRCLRGIDTLSAMTLVSEIGDIRRFRTPRQLMSYVGLAVSEFSSGDRQRRGGITKAGSERLRRILTEAAWQYRWPARISRDLRARQEGQPEELLTHCMRAQVRLNSKYHHLSITKDSREAVAAVARELTGFVWAAMHDDPQKWRLHHR